MKKLDIIDEITFHFLLPFLFAMCLFSLILVLCKMFGIIKEI